MNAGFRAFSTLPIERSTETIRMPVSNDVRVVPFCDQGIPLRLSRDSSNWDL